MNVKNIIYSLFMVFTIILAVTGCANERIEDQFVFGKSRVHCANTTITVNSPFELAVKGKQADIGDLMSTKVVASGYNKHIQINVNGDLSDTEHTVDSLKKETLKIIENDAAVSNLQVEEKTGKVGNITAEILKIEFIENNKGKNIGITIIEYIFEYNHVIWRVIYQYRTEDTVGKALSDRLAGQIIPGTVL